MRINGKRLKSSNQAIQYLAVFKENLLLKEFYIYKRKTKIFQHRSIIFDLN